TINHAELDDFVILRSDGSPVYQLAVVVDDHQMGITHVIRGEDHLSNTPKQILIYEAMSWTVPEFAHLPLIHGPDGKRLSKRHGATSVEEFHERGFLAEALFNYLCLLGWAPGDDREILSIEELIQLFSLERVGKKNAIFDQKKLDWVNGKHLSAKSSSDIIRLTASLLNEKDRKVVNADIPAFSKLIDLAKIRAQTFTELMDTISFYFEAPQTYEEKGVDTYFSSLNASDILKKLHNVLNTTESFDEATLETRIRDLADAEGVKAGQLIHPLRLALTGRTTSPGIFEILAILGKSSSLDRLNKAVAFVSGL
ncbi:MAG: glutamate--tRNA ligase, partial [Calditrichales bacterium]